MRPFAPLAAAAAALALTGSAQAAPDNLMGDFGPVTKWLHLYSASDGKTHIEEMAVPTEAGPYDMSVLLARKAVRVTIGYWPDGFVSKWHYATNQNLIVYMQGTQYIDLGDGKEHKLVVRMKQTGMSARARRSYIASPERLSAPR